jgi:dihydrodipicolinate synthase/N-acetylneuraminate lyase
VVTVLDDAGNLLEEDQRSVVRFVIQGGYGADIVFAAGTTGEWDHLSNPVRQRVAQVCIEEVAKANARRGAGQGRPVEAWAGITAHTPGETLENLEFAIEAGADAAVLAPLSIRGIDDPVRFLQRDVADLLDMRTRRIPVYLYDNADIAVDPKTLHIDKGQVRDMSRLDFVRGIKVSGNRRVLGRYTRAAASFRERGEFGIYAGNAMVIFRIYRPRRGWRAPISEFWNRHRLMGALPIGVVAGPANALPREWARAWQVCRAGDYDRIGETERLVTTFREATHAPGPGRAIACFKRAMLSMGVIGSAAVAPETRALTSDEAGRFDAAFAAIREMSTECLGPPWVSVTRGEFGAASEGLG